MPRLCVDFGGSAVKLGLVQAGDVLAASTIEVGRDFTLASLDTAAHALIGGPARFAELESIGIALPGVVDRAEGTLVVAHDKYASLIGVNLRDWATSRFGVPAMIENDARAALLGEVTFGVAAGCRDAVIMVLGTGIGTAAMMSGQLLRGARDHAGILGGHFTVQLNGPLCPCGNVGCAECFASTWALDGAATLPLSSSTEASPRNIEELIRAVQAGQPRANDILTVFVRAWGSTLVSLCHAYDPSVVIISGGAMKAHTILLPQLTSYLHEHLWSSAYRPPVLVPDHPQLSVMRGLAAIAQTESTPL